MITGIYVFQAHGNIGNAGPLPACIICMVKDIVLTIKKYFSLLSCNLYFNSTAFVIADTVFKNILQQRASNIKWSKSVVGYLSFGKRIVPLFYCSAAAFAIL